MQKNICRLCSKQALSHVPLVCVTFDGCCRPLRLTKESIKQSLWCGLFSDQTEEKRKETEVSSPIHCCFRLTFLLPKVSNLKRTITHYLTNETNIFFVKLSLFKPNALIVNNTWLLASGQSSCLFPINSQRCINCICFYFSQQTAEFCWQK